MGDATNSSLIGTVLGSRYRILEKLGEGAMAEVYLAEHLHMGRREAVKILRPEMASDPRFVARFRREARVINRVQHPNIIGIYDFGQLPDRRLYLAMEHATGRSLDRILRQDGALPYVRVLHVIHQLAAAVHHAHSFDVVHRDLKPANLVLVEHRGHADVLKVLDFGMAKILGMGEADELTHRGEVLGTPAYMAPETLEYVGADPRSDIYAIGCIAYELLVGAPPFQGAHRVELLQAHLEQVPVAPSERNPGAGIPRTLDAIVLQCLEKRPDDRYQTGQQVCIALAQVHGFPGKEGNVRTSRLRAAKGWSTGAHRVGHQHETTLSGTEGDSGVASILESMACADTAAASRSDVRAGVFQALFELAERMADVGVEDGDIMVAVARVRGLYDDEAQIQAARTSLDDRELHVEQTARERQASLRFALGELRFDQQRTSPETQADLDYQIAQLDLRLRELVVDSAEQLDAITEEGISLAAWRASLEEAWVGAHASLQRAVERRVATLTPCDEVAPILDRYRSIEGALALMSSE